MNEQIGVSGCFGSTTPYPIDDIEEVVGAVDDIVETATPSADEPSAGISPNMALAQLVGQYARRVRLLTWAVVAIVVVLVLKEVND